MNPVVRRGKSDATGSFEGWADAEIPKKGIQVVTGVPYGKANYFTRILYQMSDRDVKWKINAVVIFR